MDAHRFDALTRALTAGSRRGLLGLLLTLPGLGGLLALLAPDEADAKRRHKRRRWHKHRRRRRKNRRRRRKKHQNRNKNNDKNEHGEPCTPASLAQTCEGRCGAVRNNCQEEVDCGSCACEPPCAVCFTCQAGPTTPGACVPDAARVGDTCGDPGQVCQADGACACEAEACRQASGCCDGATCVEVDFDTDPQNCGVCQKVCTPGERCTAGACCIWPTDDLQAAIEATPDGETLHLCSGTWDLSDPVRITKSLTLVGIGTGTTILDGPGSGRVLRIADGTTVALQHLTVTSGDGGIDNAGTLSLFAVEVTGNLGNTPGTLGGGISNTGTLTLEGGSRVSDNMAHLDGGGIYSTGTLTLEEGSRVSGNTTAFGSGGGIYLKDGTLTLKNRTLVGGDSPEDGNYADSAGGGVFNEGGTATLQAGSRVSGNTSKFQGGGIYNTKGTVILEDGSRVSGNTADPDRDILEDGGGIFNALRSTVTVQPNAHVCDNSPSAVQCSGLGTFSGHCPNPTDGNCPP